MEGVDFKDMSSRLFEMSDNKMATLAEMKLLGWVRVERLECGTRGYGRGRRSS